MFHFFLSLFFSNENQNENLIFCFCSNLVKRNVKFLYYLMFIHALQLQPVIVTFRKQVFVGMGFRGRSSFHFVYCNFRFEIEVGEMFDKQNSRRFNCFRYKSTLATVANSRFSESKSFHNLHLSFQEIKEKSQQ